jgi:hypothetical protein
MVPERGGGRRPASAGRGALLHALAIAMSIAGCGEEAPPPLPAMAAPTLVATAVPPRRPTRRYYLARTSERCETFAEDGDERTDPLLTPCPDYMLVGERIRIAGMTCILENKAQPERAKPVVCPDPLTRLEKNERAAAEK